MFQDKNEELARLQQALMEVEPDEEEWEDTEEEWGDIPNYDDRVYNADKCDEDLEDYAQQVLEDRKGGVSGLIITALLLTCGILGVMVWFLLRYWG